MKDVDTMYMCTCEWAVRSSETRKLKGPNFGLLGHCAIQLGHHLSFSKVPRLVVHFMA